MSQNDIHKKLSEKLATVPKTEEDVVYVLSRIRKILETDDKPDNFSVLNFYCNLTLHSKITKPPKKVIDKIKAIKEGGDNYAQALIDLTRNDFHNQLEQFCLHYGIDSFYLNSELREIQDFYSLLLEVWSHTPIRIEYIESFELTISTSKNGMTGYKIEKVN